MSDRLSLLLALAALPALCAVPARAATDRRSMQVTLRIVTACRADLARGGAVALACAHGPVTGKGMGSAAPAAQAVAMPHVVRMFRDPRALGGGAVVTLEF